MRKKHLLIAGGGTGGHIAPAIAIGSAASEHFRVSYACTPRPVDTMMYAAVAEPVHVMNPPRIDKGMRLLLPFTATISFLKARALIKSIGADVVLGTGGYSSFFAIVAARSLGIPAAVFDSNAISGRSNRIASRFCRIAFTGLKSGETGLNCRTVQTGTPVSGKMNKTATVLARKRLGIPEDFPVILFLGGSQGAKAINDLALAVGEDVSVLLQCGNSDYKRVLKQSKTMDNFTVKPFLTDLSLWYSAAALAVARAGGQTIAELAAFGLPAVLVPYPYAAEDHQMANAAVILNAGGALLRTQTETEHSDFTGFLLKLGGDRKKLAEMSAAMQSIFPDDPAEKIVLLLRELVQ
ncbi:MAG: UDP-N-acetylglucosamine--N-acetylmuramyl-(pentapeptide) pyrophosphoryl-undecaprenol N-acetylglucosamine transferase [Candidatus Sabulitectum sp.]|nr:UDP-N-acetylglucosamine--N-acetylmuramyl-(pentapeptide) pyrophosphoryl-undecaprenol N-acetylglucosamine transferase [Candidatus Sabulitectum sp.]